MRTGCPMHIVTVLPHQELIPISPGRNQRCHFIILLAMAFPMIDPPTVTATETSAPTGVTLPTTIVIPFANAKKPIKISLNKKCCHRCIPHHPYTFYWQKNCLQLPVLKNAYYNLQKRGDSFSTVSDGNSSIPYSKPFPFRFPKQTGYSERHIVGHQLCTFCF